MNRLLSPGLETIFLSCSPQYSAFSSTVVRDVIKNNGNYTIFFTFRNYYSIKSVFSPTRVDYNMALDKNQIAKRIAQELQDGFYVNLGIGIPSLVANYIPEGIEVVLQSENGLFGDGTIS